RCPPEPSCRGCAAARACDTGRRTTPRAALPRSPAARWPPSTDRTRRARAPLSSAAAPCWHPSCQGRSSLFAWLPPIPRPLCSCFGSDNMRPSRVIVEHQSQLARVFADWFTRVVTQAIEARGQAAVALPGGSAAMTMFPELVCAPLEWAKVHLFWGDERAVPPDDSESNYGLARRLLIEPLALHPSHVHPMPAEGEPLDQAAARYSETLERVLGSPPQLDVALLGLGPDGHVCSLFPGHRLLEHTG